MIPIRNRTDPVINFSEPWLKWTWDLAIYSKFFVYSCKHDSKQRKILLSNKSTLRKIISYAKDDLCTQRMITRAKLCRTMYEWKALKTYLFLLSSPDPLVMIEKAARSRKIIVNYRIIFMMLMIWDNSLELTLKRLNLTNTWHYSNKDYNTGVIRISSWTWHYLKSISAKECWLYKINKKRAKKFCRLLQNTAHQCLTSNIFLWTNGILYKTSPY